jgi:oxaloacetate decarboxylase gamma subunit
MSETSLITDSLILMAIGMGTVFSFLLLLVLLLKVMSWLAERLAPIALESVPSSMLTRGGAADADAELIAVIGAAVARYRARRS